MNNQIKSASRVASTTVVLLTMTISTVRADDTAKQSRLSQDAEVAAQDEYARVQGTWMRILQTENGPIKAIKQHKGKTTTLTFYDANGNVLAAKTSEFRLNTSGKVRIFRFFNNVATAGPQLGQSDNASKSYIYRVTGDTFFEINGLLIGDEAEPVIFTWQRVRE